MKKNEVTVLIVVVSMVLCFLSEIFKPAKENTTMNARFYVVEENKQGQGNIQVNTEKFYVIIDGKKDTTIAIVYNGGKKVAGAICTALNLIESEL